MKTVPRKVKAMRALLVIFLALYSTVCAVTPEEKEAILHDYNQSYPRYAADSLNPEQKEWFLGYILHDISSKDARLQDTYERNWGTQLLQLGHEPTIEKHGELIKRGVVDANAVSGSHQPRLIEFFETPLFTNEPALPLNAGGDTLPGSTSGSAIDWILETTESSKEIPAETRVWASKLKSVIDKNRTMDPRENNLRVAEQARLIVRRWFTEHKTILHAREFDKLKPGLTHSSLSAVPDQLEPTPPASQKTSQESGSSTSQPSNLEVQNTKSIWPLILSATLPILLAIGLLLGRQRK